MNESATETTKTTPTGQSEAPVKASEERQEAAPTGQPTKPQTDPNIIALQQQYSKTVNDLQRARQQAEQQAAELAARLEAIETADLDDAGRANYQVQKLQRELAARDAEIQTYRVEKAKSDVFALINEKTKAPIHVFSQAQSPDEAWALAHEWSEKQWQARSAATTKEPEKEPSIVDAGSGGNDPITEWEAAAAKAYKEGPVAYMKALRQRPK